MRFILALLIPGMAVAAPVTFQQSGRLLDANGDPVNTPVTLTLTLHTAESNGLLLHTDSFPALSPEDGYYSVGLGSTSTLDSGVFADNPEIWLQIKVGTSDPMDRQRLLSVPFAAYALEAGSGGGSDFFCSDAGGTWCPDGYACTTGTCVAATGEAPESAGLSCKDLYAAGVTTSDVYYLDPDEGDSSNAYQAYCDMDTSPGGWTLVAKVYGANANNLLWATWTGSSVVGNQSDFSLVSTADVLYPAHFDVKADAILFADHSSTCGSDHRLLETTSLMGDTSLRDYLIGLPQAHFTNTTAANFSTPAYRNTGCTQPFNPTPNVRYYANNVFGINISHEPHRLRFTINEPSYDNGIASELQADGGYEVGDMDVDGDGVNSWGGHPVTIFVR